MPVASGQPLAVSIPNPFSIGSDQLAKSVVNAVTQAINAFFGGLVTDALNPLLKLLGQTLLTTPEPSALPRVGQLWENSRQIAVAVYALIILAAGILLMAYETLQTRQGIKEIAPRLVVGFISANMSLLLAGKAVSFANALSTGLLGQGVDARSAAGSLTSLVLNAVTNGGIFLSLMGIGLACVLLALLVGYVVRVALTVILIAGAPLALMCHALPQTEGIARWWWRAFAGVLAIQIAQSLTLVAAMDVFLTPGGFSFFGPTADGLVNVIVTFALLYILYKIPFWILHSIRVGGGRSMLGGLVKGLIAYKTLGLLGLRRGAAGGRSRGPGRPGGPPGPTGGGPRRAPRPGGPPPSGGGQPRRPRPVRPTGGAAPIGSAAGSALRRPAQSGALAASNPVAPRAPASEDRAAGSPARPLAPVRPAERQVPATASQRSFSPGRARAPHRPIPVAHRPTGAAPPRTAASSQPPTPTRLGPTAPPVDLPSTARTRRRPTYIPPPAARPATRLQPSRGDAAR